MGAQCAGASDELCAKYAEFGELLGIAAQLDNDCNDLYYLLYSQGWALSSEEIVRTSNMMKSDLVRGKKTLPIVLAAEEIAKTQGASTANMQDALQQAATLSDTENEAYMRAFREGIQLARCRSIWSRKARMIGASRFSMLSAAGSTPWVS